MSPGWGWEGGPLEGALTQSLWPGPQLALPRGLRRRLSRQGQGPICPGLVTPLPGPRVRAGLRPLGCSARSDRSGPGTPPRGARGRGDSRRWASCHQVAPLGCPRPCGPGNQELKTNLSQPARPDSSVTPAPCLVLRGQTVSAGLLNSLVKNTFHPTHHSRFNLKIKINCDKGSCWRQCNSTEQHEY